MSSIYPLKFVPVYKEVLWGGSRIGQIFDRQLPSGKTGESWELCSHQNGMSVVANGSLAGKTVAELLQSDKAAVMGAAYAAAHPENRFPLLVKIIDANDNLSIQVHPGDEYAYRVEQEPGKSEAWYVLAAEENAQIVYGLREDVTKEAFGEALRRGNPVDALRYVPVKAGDMIYIPSGVVHAALKGVMVYEVQQNSDTTYRIYDFHRVGQDGKPRQLHIDKALDVIRFGGQESTDFSVSCISCRYFSMEKAFVGETREGKTNDSFVVLCIVAGEGRIAWQEGSMTVRAGETVLIPACLGEYVLSGKLEFLEIR